MLVFRRNLALKKLEDQRKWGMARNLLYNNWRSNIDDLDSLLRVGTECWFVLSYWEELKIKGPSREFFSAPLTEAKQYGEIHFCESDEYLWLFGYMIKLFPYWFDDFDGDLYKNENIGKEMIKKSYSINPQNYIAKMLCLPEHTNEHVEIRKKIQLSLKDCFPGDSEVEQYFTRVFGTPKLV